jgi:hypothetical protein
MTELKERYQAEGNPVVSVDTKKKGNYSPLKTSKNT